MALVQGGNASGAGKQTATGTILVVNAADVSARRCRSGLSSSEERKHFEGQIGPFVAFARETAV
jgi:hypothetical protein